LKIVFESSEERKNRVKVKYYINVILKEKPVEVQNLFCLFSMIKTAKHLEKYTTNA